MTRYWRCGDLVQHFLLNIHHIWVLTAASELNGADSATLGYYKTNIVYGWQRESMNWQLIDG